MCPFSLKVKQVSNKEPEEKHHLLSHTSDNVPAPVDNAPAGKNKVNVVLLFLAAILYDFAVGGAVEILGSFVMKAPLSWTATQVTFFSLDMCVCVFYLNILQY